MTSNSGNAEAGRNRSVIVRLAVVLLALGLTASGILYGCGSAPFSRKATAERDPDVIPNQYLVAFVSDDGEFGFMDEKQRTLAMEQRDRVAQEVNRSQQGRVIGTPYDSALIGFSAVMSSSLAARVEGLPKVEVIKSKRVRLAAGQTRPPYGLDRLGQRLLPLDRYYAYHLTGEGVHVYLVDSGIMESNPQFAGRIGKGKDFIDGSMRDCEGHGTHVAGTIGATKYGVANKVTLHSVRVAGCSDITSTDNVIAALNWIMGNAVSPAIVNMSLSTSDYPALDALVEEAMSKKKLVFTVAAGNVDDDHADPDACKASPAKVDGAITVGATDPGMDRIAPFSFRGGCVDLFAPGVNILSARNDDRPHGALMDGTSMAAAHAAGVAALYLEACKRAKIQPLPGDVWKAVKKYVGAPGVANWGGLIKHPKGSPNKLLYWGAAGQPTQSSDNTLCPGFLPGSGAAAAAGPKPRPS